MVAHDTRVSELGIRGIASSKANGRLTVQSQSSITQNGETPHSCGDGQVDSVFYLRFSAIFLFSSLVIVFSFVSMHSSSASV